jgi:hypothetical protein
MFKKIDLRFPGHHAAIRFRTCPSSSNNASPNLRVSGMRLPRLFESLLMTSLMPRKIPRGEIRCTDKSALSQFTS